MRRWKCLLCGYIHEGEEAPEKCPVCGGDKVNFIEVDEQGKEIKAQQEKKEVEAVQEVTPEADVKKAEKLPEEPQQGEEKKEEPETSELSAESEAEELDSSPEKLAETEAAKEEEPKPAEEAVESGKQDASEEIQEKPSRSFLGWLGGLVMKLHLHPISVHTPNGVLPMAVLFMVLAIYYNYQTFELPSFYSLAFVLAAMPVVVFTGYLEWQMRYRGAKTFLFITKIFCSIVALACVSTLVIWRVVDPGVAGPESPERMTYLIVGLVALGAVGIAGHLGGKLVFGRAGG